MKKMKTIAVFLVLMLVMAAGSRVASASSASSKYEYPITVLSEDWFGYSVLEKNSMLRIDENVSKEMTDRQLVQAVADFAYLVDIYVCDTMQEGLRSFRVTCDAFDVLMKRENGVESFLTYSRMLIDEMKENPRADGRTEFVAQALMDICEQLTEESESAGQCSSERAVPYTPNGNQ